MQLKFLLCLCLHRTKQTNLKAKLKKNNSIQETETARNYFEKQNKTIAETEINY